MDLMLALIALHTVADWECQTDWQAMNKSKNVWALASHVLVDTTVVTVGIAIYCLVASHGSNALSLTQVVWFWLLTFWLHFSTDAVTSRMTAFYMGDGPIPSTAMLSAGVKKVVEYSEVAPREAWLAEDILTEQMREGMVDGPKYRPIVHFRRHRFFATIGYDQLWHYVCLYLTWRLVVSY
jgi:hypothetical protein